MAHGVGKSHVAQALVYMACRREYTVTFTRCSRVLADLAGGRADGSWEARLRRWARSRLLIVDDFGLRAFTAGQADDLYALVAERRGGSFILASNRARLTGTGCSPIPWSPRRCSTGWSTPPTTWPWSTRASVPTTRPPARCS